MFEDVTLSNSYLISLCLIFIRSDIRVISGHSQITEWVDKSHLLSTAADREGCTLMWHKIVLLQSGALGRQVQCSRVEWGTVQ